MWTGSARSAKRSSFSCQLRKLSLLSSFLRLSEAGIQLLYLQCRTEKNTLKFNSFFTDILTCFPKLQLVFYLSPLKQDRGLHQFCHRIQCCSLPASQFQLTFSVLHVSPFKIQSEKEMIITYDNFPISIQDLHAFLSSSIQNIIRLKKKIEFLQRYSSSQFQIYLSPEMTVKECPLLLLKLLFQ